MNLLNGPPNMFRVFNALFPPTISSVQQLRQLALVLARRGLGVREGPPVLEGQFPGAAFRGQSRPWSVRSRNFGAGSA
jgi:hypothetical protein